jgi:integrase
MVNYISRFVVCEFHQGRITYNIFHTKGKSKEAKHRPDHSDRAGIAYLAVNTGLRPSEQVALKWSVIEKDSFSVELSRVRNREKEDLKTESSYRQIAITSTIRDILHRQKAMTAAFDSDYVFVNNGGRPILQGKLRELWHRAMKKSGLPRRRMYETRHTFASWSIAAGEAPEWVASTLGHVDISMVFGTYGRYIPNLTRQDGSAFERLYKDRQGISDPENCA